MVRADGIERVVPWRASASIEDARIYAIGRDVTDERVAQAQSIRSHRMEAIAEMTTAAAQDLTRVLSAVYSYVELARRLTPDAQLRRVLDSADGSIRRGGSVVNQLLSFARSQKLAPGPIDVNAFVRGIHGLATRLTGPGTSFEYDLADELPAVKADPTQLELAFVNLCLNAREAMPEGGTVSVITRKHIVSHEVANTSELPEGKCVVLCVRDSGHGMDPVTLSRCVEPFFSTRAAGQRAGLGLPQVQGFARQCGGAVRVSSQLVRGHDRAHLLAESSRRVEGGRTGRPLRHHAGPGNGARRRRRLGRFAGDVGTASQVRLRRSRGAASRAGAPIPAWRSPYRRAARQLADDGRGRPGSRGRNTSASACGRHAGGIRRGCDCRGDAARRVGPAQAVRAAAAPGDRQRCHPKSTSTPAHR